MPFSFSSGGVATALDGTYSTCRSNSASLPSWAQPTYTAKRRSEWSTGVYATTAQTANGCTFYFLQYCRDNASGTNGRSWQVEYFCSGDDGTTVSHLESEVLDWNCTCAGARYEFSFAGAVADDYGCCLAGATVTACGCADLPETVIATVGGCVAADITLIWENPALPLSSSSWAGSLSMSASCCIEFYLACVNPTTHEFNASIYVRYAGSGACTGPAFTNFSTSPLHTGCDLFPITGSINVTAGTPLCGSCPAVAPASGGGAPYTIPFTVAV